jgi:hypothetical protein
MNRVCPVVFRGSGGLGVGWLAGRARAAVNGRGTRVGLAGWPGWQPVG